MREIVSAEFTHNPICAGAALICTLCLCVERGVAPGLALGFVCCFSGKIFSVIPDSLAARSLRLLWLLGADWDAVGRDKLVAKLVVHPGQAIAHSPPTSARPQ